MEQKRVSFKVAKAIKEAGYNEPCDMYYHIYDDMYDSETSLEMTGNGCKDFINSLNRYRCAAPTYIEVWLWLWREKNIRIYTKDYYGGLVISESSSNYDSISHADPEEAISAAIDAALDYLIKNK